MRAKLYKQFSDVFDTWTFFTKKGTQWYTYMNSTAFTKQVWPTQFDIWIETDHDQDPFIEHGIIQPAFRLEFLLLTGKDFDETTKDLKEGTKEETNNEIGNNGRRTLWSFGSPWENQSNNWATYTIGRFSP